MACETCPAMLMITSSPAPASASSVTCVCRLSCHRPFTPAFRRTLIHSVRNVVTGRHPLPSRQDEAATGAAGGNLAPS